MKKKKVLTKETLTISLIYRKLIDEIIYNLAPKIIIYI